jgi:drug/metabolite transporter (DMT)-like permease
MSLDIALFALLAAFWGGSFVAIKFAVAAFPPAFSAMIRVGIALVVLTVILRGRGRGSKPTPASRRRMWLAGFFSQGLPFALLFWGERRISPGLAGIVNGTVPVWTFLFGLLRGEEIISPRRIAGLGAGFAGIALICAPLVAFHGTRSETAGLAAVFGMALAYGYGARLTRTILNGPDRVDMATNALHQQAASLVFLVGVSLAADRWPSPSMAFAEPTATAALIYLGVFSTAFAFLIFYRLIREWGAVRASAVTYVVPAVALFWDYVFFHNTPTALEAIGALVVLAGVVLLSPAVPPPVKPVS